MDQASEREWRRGWRVVGAGLVGMTVMALHSGVLGVMMKPLGQIFGWQRSEISAGLTILTIVQLIAVPVVGLLIARIGVRRLALAGGLLYALGMLLLACSTRNIWSWYAGWLVLGTGLIGIGPVSWTTAIARSFDAQRGLALSIALSGVGIATFISPWIAAWAMEALGWRAAFVALSLLVAFILVPLIWALMANATQFDPYEREAPRADRAPLRLFADRRVWQLMVASLLMAACVGTVMVHLQAIMRDAGATTTQAAAYFTITGPMLIVGRLVSGFLLDRLPPRLVAAGLFALPAVCCALLLGYDGSAFWGIGICLILGVGYGSENDILAYLCARYFGVGDYPQVYSFVYGAFALGYGLSAVLAGAVFDHLGSYARILVGLMAGAVVGIGLILALGRSPSDLPHPLGGAPA